jgi:hypothetical protein
MPAHHLQSQDVIFRCGMLHDIQLGCGAGLEPTKAFLRESSVTQKSGKYTGDFEGSTPERHLDFYRRSYGVSS